LTDERVKVVECRRVPGRGLTLVLSQTVKFPKPVKVWDPKRRVMTYHRKREVFYDASIPEDQMRLYEMHSVGRDARERILVLLGVLGQSYPTTAIAKVTGISRGTAQRMLWEMSRDGLVAGERGKGAYTEFYTRGPLREWYYLLTKKGAREAEKLLKVATMPLFEERRPPKREKPITVRRIRREMVWVEIDKPVDRFIGFDRKHYGPFKVGDAAFIPVRDAERLEKIGKVRIID